MKKVLVASIALGALLCTTNAFASVEKGQKLYLKACKSCHGNGVKGSALHSQAEWDKIFSNGGKALIDAHQKDPKAAPYFNGPFKGHMNDLHDFLHEYGNDSGNVPACG
jgi:cytochrome c5